ncbi:UxaA family hydrolase [Sphingorhabdus sp.]|uniref:UxaA family hydrolase n=1 Tax=Sphingorhabdus sp. TaxID=1902408 RepID=UPI00391B3356
MPPRFIIANALDNVAVAIADLSAGEKLHDGWVVAEAISAGHKIALRPIKCGEGVIKLGQPIGVATQAIAAGSHVHSHNLHFSRDEIVGETSIDLRHLAPVPATFDGFVRSNGRVGTRNYIGILTSVNCSATVAKRIAAHFTPERLSGFPNVDGVVAFNHLSGCGMAKAGRGMDNLRRTLTGYASHPNFGAVVIVGLGCEVNQLDPLLASAGLVESDHLRTLGIQEAGGTLAAIEAGIAIVQSMLPAVNHFQREAVSAQYLTLGLQCGASDGYSALTANPALGDAVDMLVAAGGRAILSETPEIYGAENLLLRRAASPQVAEDLIARLKWWEEYAAREGASLDNNPSPGNKAGGITTILEKSLGAVAKAGSTPLNAVVDYAEFVTAPGLSFMDSPGYDPCSATGQIAAGANMILFTTGRGSVFGSLPSPTIKLGSNAALAKAMADDIDVDCSRILDGVSAQEMAAEIFQVILATATGQKTVSESFNMGESELVPWIPGAVY